ncbi:MAG: InlB B-repeat-containing protein, partial [Muribaculaceae bacterium]|nr:InlB B-repeat-containing protein [Muribaculaceae bacterium]
TYVVDGETYRQLTVDFGTEIVPEETPQKEGHSFSGWEGLPQTMPAHDVTVTGVFTINSYTLTVYLDGELFHTEVLEFGAAIEIPVPEVAEGWKFDGWQEEVPETMPAYDLEIHGTTSELSHLEAVRGDASDKVTIFTLEGVKVAENASYEAMRDRLTPGIYIVNGRKVAVR